MGLEGIRAMYKIAIVSATAWLALLPDICRAQDASRQLQVAIDKVHKAQDKLPSKETRYKVKSNSTQTSTSSGKTTTQRKIYVEKCTDDMAVVSVHEEGVLPKRSNSSQLDSMLLILNDRYFLSANRNSRNHAWLLKSVQANDGTLSEASNEQYRILRLFSGKPAFATMLPLQLRCGETPVAELTKLPNFVADPANIHADDAVVTFGFRYSFTPPGESVSFTSVCTVSFDVAGFGVPARLTEESNSGPSDTRSALLEQELTQVEKDRYAYKSHRRNENKSNGKTIYKAETIASGEFKLGRVADSEFTATAYGLPEPPGFEPPHTPLYVWLLVAAGVLFASSLLLRRVVAARRLAVRAS